MAEAYFKRITAPQKKFFIAQGALITIGSQMTQQAHHYLTSLIVNQGSKNMIQALWFDLNRVNGGAARPAASARTQATPTSASRAIPRSRSEQRGYGDSGTPSSGT